MTVIAVVVLAVAVALFGVRLVLGPTLADRVVALNGIVIVGMVLVAIDAMRSDRSAFLPVLVVLAVVGFVGTAMIARFLQGRGR
jgi:multisubunit Na+/H+ antiporter MnhF subunit